MNWQSKIYLSLSYSVNFNLILFNSIYRISNPTFDADHLFVVRGEITKQDMLPITSITDQAKI